MKKNNYILKEAVVLLIAVALIFSTVTITAEEQISSAYTKINENTVRNKQTRDTILKPNSNDRSVLFTQEPLGPNDPERYFYPSATNLNCRTLDNYGRVTEPICDIHWWGFTLVWNFVWFPGEPVGMKFDISFWTDADGQPDHRVCYYPDVSYTVTGTGIYYTWSGYDCELYYFEADLYPCCSLEDGWVLIQSIYSPSESSFCWMNSNDGDAWLWLNSDWYIDDVSFVLTGNDPPSAPTITGETNGKAGVEYTYCIINATDPDGDDIWANFSWGDGSYSGWIGPNTSGEDICASHAWERGNYEIKAKLKDEWGLESDWSDPLPITMPKNKPFDFNFNRLNWWFERFPNMFPILRYLLRL